MSNPRVALILGVLALVVNYEYTSANTAAPSPGQVIPSIQASTAVLESSSGEVEEKPEPPMISDVPAGADEPEVSLSLLKRSFANEFASHPHLYDAKDAADLINDPDSVMAGLFLNQRSNNWERAYWLAVDTLRWRAKMGINQLTASLFPCDLFRLGLIFEDGNAYNGNPVIWVRLGALGSVIKQMEKLTPKKVTSFAYNTLRSAAKKSKRAYRRARRSRKRRQQNVEKAPMIENLTVKNDQTISNVLRAIAWWLNDWRSRQPVDTRATLVLDFENNDYALSSWSMGEFFIGLDDHFPDMFEQVIGFRFKPKLWSLHSPISMFNRIFKSRIQSSPETDAKLKFVKLEPEISSFMPRVDANGFTMLPEHVAGNSQPDCLGPTREPPAGCQEDADALVASGLYDPHVLQAIRHEFYQICKPRLRADQIAS